jgi:type VI secretion system protein ImpM
VTHDLQIGWFGKLPSDGDFAHRRMPRSVLDVLDDWLRRGLAQLQARSPAAWRDSFAAAPTWNCAIPAPVAGGMTLVGLIAPSRDRVGRQFPLCAGVVLPPEEPVSALLADAHGWLRTLGKLVIDARDQQMPLEAFDAAIRSIAVPRPGQYGGAYAGADDILAILGSAESPDIPTVPMPLAHALPWPELPMTFDARQSVSYWWTNAGAGHPLRGFTTESDLAPSLLVTLVQPLVGRNSRSTS